MKSTIPYYKQQLEEYQQKVKDSKTSITNLSMLRLLVFLATAFGIYFFFNEWKIAVIIALIGTAVFLFLLIKYTNAKRQQALFRKLVLINSEEIQIANGEFYHRDTGFQFENPLHYYSLDIDLFGEGSFFQFLNRTSISEGTLKLANELKANSTKDIISRQEAIKELATKPKWRQYFQATASLIRTEKSTKGIISWLQQYKTFVPKVISWIGLTFSSLSIVLFTLTLFNIISSSFLFYWLLLGLGITGTYLKKINKLSTNVDAIKYTFRQYAQLLNQIENEQFTSQLLKKQQQNIQSEGKKASNIFTQFSKILDAFDNRNNIIFNILGNGLFLIDLKNASKIEQWIEQYNTTVENWFETVAYFDAYNSLGNYVYNHSSYVFPEITESNEVLNTENLGHPLLAKEKRVDNSILINRNQFFIITGANMAGKSTFLRAVSLNIVMANVGLPVCATSCTYNPVKLITSMRTDDSLNDESSYFFSELKRLKFIVDEIKNGEYFIILDEILKGTNSTDKSIGSRKFVEKLVKLKATGIIATHDLNLCELEEDLSEINNHYFDAEIINNELHFDYTFKKGICQNMNANFLLKKMEII